MCLQLKFHVSHSEQLDTLWQVDLNSLTYYVHAQDCDVIAVTPVEILLGPSRTVTEWASSVFN